MIIINIIIVYFKHITHTDIIMHKLKLHNFKLYNYTYFFIYLNILIKLTTMIKPLISTV